MMHCPEGMLAEGEGQVRDRGTWMPFPRAEGSWAT